MITQQIPEAPDKGAHLLVFDAISTFYGPIRALHNISLRVDAGEIVTIIGANGAGKSTLLMTIFASPAAQQGRVMYEGMDITRRATNQIADLGIALVPEGRRIFPGMTVEENLLIGGLKIPAQELRQNLDRVYELFPLLAERRSQRAGTLSGGEQQMLSIGRGLMGKPKLLLLDEPSLGLAPLIVRQIFAKLKTIAEEGVTILLVEQNANLALKLAERGYVLVNGEIKLAGKCQDLLANKEVQVAYLGG